MNKLMENIKNIKLKYIHLAIIIIGVILMLICGLHTNLWFDETYSVGLVNQNLSTLISAGAADVHPLLYYFALKIWSLVFGTSIISLRIFSIIGMITLSLLGYTHIRKDFGEKTGIIYSFLVSFLPMTLIYSSEIRMYSWAAVLVTLTAIYALRTYMALGKRKQKWKDIENKKEIIKNISLFIIFSVCSAYTHYFALIAICVINIILLAAIVKNKKNEITWIIAGGIQIALYIPGILIFLKQALRVSRGFWISIKYPDIFKEILVFNFTGNLSGKEWNTVILIFALLVTIFSAYRVIKYLIDTKNNKSNVDSKMNISILGLAVYIVVIVIGLLASCITPIFIARYTIPMAGILFIFLAYIFSQDKYRLIRIVSGTVIIVICIANFVVFYNENYNKNNMEPEKYIDSKIQDSDIFIYNEINVGGIIAVKYPENTQFFYNQYNWSVEEGYKAYLPQMKIITKLDEMLEEYSGRIWIIDLESKELTNKILDMEDIEEIEETKEFHTSYKDITMVVTLVQK